MSWSVNFNDPPYLQIFLRLRRQPTAHFGLEHGRKTTTGWVPPIWLHGRIDTPAVRPRLRPPCDRLGHTVGELANNATGAHGNAMAGRGRHLSPHQMGLCAEYTAKPAARGASPTAASGRAAGIDPAKAGSRGAGCDANLT